MSIEREDPVYDFIRQYGWSIVFFDEDYTKNNTFAAILDDIPNTRTSQLERLWIRSKSEAGSGLDRLDKIISRSPNFKDLGLYVDLRDENQFKTAQSLLGRHGQIISALNLENYSFEGYSWLTSTFPTRDSFPTLVSLEIRPWKEFIEVLTFLPWITTMVSTPSPRSTSPSQLQSSSSNVGDKGNINHEFKSTGSWTPLRKIMLSQIKPGSKEWMALIDAIDLSTLEDLDLLFTNFSQVQLELLMDRISVYSPSTVPLKTLDISFTYLVENTHPQALEAMLAELRRKAPLVRVVTRG
jgi:hypothetical protein